MEGVNEYFFDNYYRVVVLEDEGGFLVSVDVYITDWRLGEPVEKCINNTCLLVKEITLNNSQEYPCNPSKITIIGVKTSGKRETISVKWLCREKPGYNQIQALYELSWRIARGEQI